MQDKIFQLLKDKAGKTSVNDRTLKAYAKLIAGKTTDESQIEAELVQYLELIKEVDGNINSVAKQATIEKEKELQSKYTPSKKETETEPEKKYLTAEDLQAILNAQNEQANKVRSFERMVSKAESALLSKGLKPKLLSKLMKDVKQSDDLTEESIIAAVQREYDELYSDIAPESGAPAMARMPNGDQVPSGIADFIANKKAEIAASNEKKELV